VTAISNYLRDRTQRVFDVKNQHRSDLQLGERRRLSPQSRHLRQLRAEYALNNERVLVHLSNFRPVKRLTDVIEIFDRVHKQVPSKLLLIGDGPDRSVAEWLAVQKGIHDDVLFLGKQDRVQDKLSIADIMLMPSELESFGLAALEAMACEVVPIATRAGGVPEVIEHGKERLPRRRRRRGDHGALRSRTAHQRTATAGNGKQARAVASIVSVPRRSSRNTRTSTGACSNALRKNLPEPRFAA
jgi:N-acetyl-alpha-D-glucosaminyl L-malate synthase BshA